MARARGLSRALVLRAWLYRIATNACLDALERRPPPADEADLPWLQPYPDELLQAVPDRAAGPEAAAESKETIELAFLAAIQHLPPRQRAVLILRDALGWSASETAELMEASPAAANSVLQRAREALAARLPARRADWPRAPEADVEERALLGRYIDAMERADVTALVAMLADDARMTMPPYPARFEGADAIAAFHSREVFGGGREFRHLATRANRQPAAAVYMRGPGETGFSPLSIDVLRIEDGRLAEITAFVLPQLFPRFGLPESLHR